MVTYPSRIYPCWLPCEGGRSFSDLLDFATDTDFVLDFQAAQSKDQLSMLRSLYIDNLANNSSVVFNIPTSGQLFTIPANSQGYMPFHVPNPPLIYVSSAGGVTVRIEWLNMYIPPQLWGPTISGILPGGEDFLITEGGDFITTEGGDFLVTE